MDQSPHQIKLYIYLNKYHDLYYKIKEIMQYYNIVQVFQDKYKIIHLEI